MTDARREEVPHDRMTRLCDAMLQALEADAEYTPTVQAIVMLTDGKRSGVAYSGYEDDAEAIADLLQHLQAIGRVNGKQIDIAFLGQTGVDRVDG